VSSNLRFVPRPRCKHLNEHFQNAWKLLVVDDHSSEPVAEVARAPRRGDADHRASKRARPMRGILGAPCRAKARSFCFISTPTCVSGPRRSSQVAAHFDDDPSLDALFGSYDGATEVSGLYLALQGSANTPTVHQHGRPQASTFLERLRRHPQNAFFNGTRWLSTKATRAQRSKTLNWASGSCGASGRNRAGSRLASEASEALEFFWGPAKERHVFGRGIPLGRTDSRCTLFFLPNDLESATTGATREPSR